MGDKVEATKWATLAICGLVVLALIGYGLRMVSFRVEREVLVSSHQYKEGMAERVATLQASLAGIDVRLSTTTDPAMRSGLEAQRATINVQLQAARR